jgi:tripartite-type tricarboxylate transporter receptor subunit TctC
MHAAATLLALAASAALARPPSRKANGRPAGALDRALRRGGPTDVPARLFADELSKRCRSG